MISQTICTKSNACADNEAVPPLFPTSQNPILATWAPAQRASWQPHQYVTPFTPHTGSVVKHLTGQETRLSGAAQTFGAVSDRMVGNDLRLRLKIDITRKKSDNDDLEHVKNIIVRFWLGFFVQGELKKARLSESKFNR
ncbi:hypothetical protein OWV82_005425 [Melia azedarach]|uniref:Uncharacterized protein n=1 Tax=Melia azedarach TaxID=155640 RepID=A0ACC1YTJ5_MELAZ|nr:hypothetical protein OWV82_005425 [Melia azedarach]